MSDNAPSDFDEKAAARILNFNPRTLRRWRKAGLIGHYLTSTGRVRYTADDLLAFRSAGRTAKTETPSESGRTCPQLSARVQSTDDGASANIGA